MIIYNGASGGIGRYLGPCIADRGLEGRPLASRLEDQDALATELAELRATGEVTFIHLAARVSVPACEADPVAAHRINVELAAETARRVFDWASGQSVSVRMVYVSSGHVYAAGAEGVRLSEDAPLGPRSVYARTKLHAEEMLSALSDEAAMPMRIARVFGLVAPRQQAGYVLPSLVERVRTDRLDVIPGLDFSRDYLDARDVCEAILDLAGAEWTTGSRVVNVCSGVPVTIRELLAAVVRAWTPAIDPAVVDTALAGPGRPDDVRWIVGDPSRLEALTGRATRRTPLATTVADAVSDATGGAEA